MLSWTWTLSVLILLTSSVRSYYLVQQNRRPMTSIHRPFFAVRTTTDPSPILEPYQNLTARFASLLAKESGLHIFFEDLNQHTYVVPRSFINATDDEIWTWWQRKKETEKILKSAIASNMSDIRPYFETYKEYLSIDKADALQANEDFFRALNEGNLDTMQALWMPGEEAICIRADDGVVRSGYEEILRDWENRFVVHDLEPTKRASHVQFYTQDVEMTFNGDCAIVRCTAEPKPRTGFFDLTSKTAKKQILRKFRSTNIFKRDASSDRFRLVAHIGTILQDRSDKAIAMLQRTYTDPTLEKRKSRRPREGELLRLLSRGGVVGRVNDDQQDDEEEDGDDSDSGEKEEVDGDDDGDDDDVDEDVEVSIDIGEGKVSSSKGNIAKMMRKMMFGSLAGGADNSIVVVGGEKGRQASLGELLRRISGDIDEDDDEDDNDGDDDDNDDNNIDKDLAARTITTIQWLFKQNRLSRPEKKKLVTDIISNVGSDTFSDAEVAFSLLICGGRPGVDILNIPDPYFDVSGLDEEDLAEFEDVCHAISLTEGGGDSDKLDDGDDDDADDDE